MDVVAGDGTKVKASASMAANATAEQPDLDIAELEALLAAEVSTWMAQARAQDEAEDALSGDGDDPPGGPGGGGRPGTPKRTADKLLRRQQAKARLAAEAAARQQAAEAARAEKIARLERRVAARRASAQGEEAAAAARVARYQRRAAAKAAAGHGGRVAGTVPAAGESLAHVRSTRQRAETAQRDLAAALAISADPGRPPKASTTDPSSRVMPGKQGGYLQGYNPQVIAGKHQVILSIGTHDSPNDVTALHPALALARANLDAAGISDPIAKALFDAGYASEDNFTTASETELYVAVTRESRQTGRRRDGRKQATAYPGWLAMTARLDTPEGKALCKRRSAMIEPVFAQLFNRLGRHLNYRGTRTSLELHLWAASHNLLKAIRASNRRHARPATPSLAPAS